MEQNPSTIAPNGRDHRGKFAPGNPGGPGNPHVRKVAKLRRAMFKAVTPKDVADVLAMLVAQAKAGDLVAAGMLLDRVFGRAPVALSGPDGGPVQLSAVDARAIFDVNGFAAHIQAFDAHQATEARRLAGNGEQ